MTFYLDSQGSGTMSGLTSDYNITIGGSAGQGMQTLGVLLSKLFLRQGYFVSTYPSYQSRIRGGHNYFQIRVSSQPIHSMKTTIDLLICLDKETLTQHCEELDEKSLVLFDRERITSGVTCGTPLSLEMSRIFSEALSNEVYGNTVFFGIVAGLLQCPGEPGERLLAETFVRKDPDIIQTNMEAFRAGFNFVQENKDWKNRFAVASPDNDKPSMTIDGNQALALGAMAAGCKFYTAYPMTPSTSILETMAHFADKAGMVVEQAEDEIAALNMVLGATYAGLRAMTGTSGGGFALMVEALSLAGMLECPAVIVDAQRPGPATGLPTRTEQADLEFVIHAGHGEFPRVVLAPGSHRDCFELTVHAFNLADRYQIPVIILTDQYLADLFGHVEPFNAMSVTIDRGKLVDPDENYVRYRMEADGVSPRGIPGRGDGTVVVDSDEHTEDGHLTEDLESRNRMNEKRLSKYAPLREEMLSPEVVGEDRQNAVLCWGSSRGACLDSVQQLQKAGHPVSLVSFKQLWPLNRPQIMTLLKRYKNLICVEGNATGQLARLLRAETSLEITNQILKSDGRPFFQNELVNEIKKLLA